MSSIINAYNLSSYFDISSYFSKNSNSNSNFTSNIYSGLSDLSSIKNGTYKKLLTSYYSKVNSSTDDIDTTNTQKHNKIVAKDASNLYSSIDNLSKTKFNDSNISNIQENVESFINNYNSLISSAGDSDTKSVLQKTLWLTNQTKANTNVLDKVGINVNNDNTLSLDTEKLNSASLSSLQSVFSNNNHSFLSNIKYNSTQIYTEAIKNSGILNTGSAYTSNGKYSSISVSSILDTYL